MEMKNRRHVFIDDYLKAQDSCSVFCVMRNGICSLQDDSPGPRDNTFRASQAPDTTFNIGDLVDNTFNMSELTDNRHANVNQPQSNSVNHTRDNREGEIIKNI